MRHIIRKEFKLMIREKGNVFFLILMPLIFIVVFGSIFNQVGTTTVTIHVQDLDRTAASKVFIKQLDQIKGFTVSETTGSSVDAQIRKIKSGDLSSLVVLDRGFEQGLKQGNGKILFYSDGAQVSAAAPVQAVLENMAGRYRDQKLAQALAARGMDAVQIRQVLAPSLQVQSITENGKHTDFMSQIVPGYTVMFVFFIMISMLQRFFQERDSGMIARLQGTPLNSVSYLIGMWIPPFVSVLIQCTILLAVGKIFYGLYLGNLLAIALIVLALGFCGTGLGLGLSMLARSQNQGIGFTQLIALGGAIVGGLWFPAEMLPAVVRQIGYFTPQYWAMQGFQDVMIRGAGAGRILPNLLILIVFGLIGLVIALYRFKPFIRAAVR